MTNYKKFFPVFSHHPNLIFLDSGASSQKPEKVLSEVKNFSEISYANIHRGNYRLSQEATKKYDAVRGKVAKFVGTREKNIIFTKNGTEASNIFAHGFSENFLEKGDEILIPISEHHANMLPWMRSAEKIGAQIIWIEPNEDGVFTLKDFEKNISSKTKIIAFSHVSNVTGQIFPVQEIAKTAKEKNIFTMLDACQSVPHMGFNFEKLGVDAAFFTGHKFGAGGTGGLILSEKFFNAFSPLLIGGDIVESVSKESYTLMDQPERFETGTPAIENIVGLGSTIDFLEDQAGGMENIFKHEQELVHYAMEQLESKLPSWNLVGPKENRSGNITLVHPKIHHEDVGILLSEKNICVRTGFHCAHPLHKFLDCSGTVRASFWIYNEKHEIDALINALQEIEEMFV